MNIPEIIFSRERVTEIRNTLACGIRDYMAGHGFAKAVLGLSGGIDSAVVCCLAEEAVGRENVLGLFMPSKYSSDESGEYAKRLAENLGIQYRSVPIGRIYDVYLDTLGKDLSVDGEEGIEVYLQNIQARIRGNILMAFSNRFGHIVLAAGNKSEALMGYCTLYGDTVGGLAPLSDTLKTTVYQVAGLINSEKEVIPNEIIDRHPTAELKPGQKDQDTLPPYEVLDGILYFLEKGCSEAELAAKGFDALVVREVITAVERTGYKRRQSPPGIKLG